MDNIQALILNYRLEKLDDITQKRRSNANLYIDNINVQGLFIPAEKNFEFNVYHTFVVQTSFRDELKDYLYKKSVCQAHLSKYYHNCRIQAPQSLH